MSSDNRSGKQPPHPAPAPDDDPCPRTHHEGLGTLGHDEVARRRGKTSRRQFLGVAALSTAGLIAAPRLLKPGQALASQVRPVINRDPRIVRTYHPGATTGWTTVNQEPVDAMVHLAIKELTGVSPVAEAWKSLFPGITTSSRIAIKVNLSCGDVPTHPEVVNAIIDGLLMMDLDGQKLPPENIIVWDYDNPFFCAQTGYTQNWGGPGVQYAGSDHPSIGHDASYTFPISHPYGSITYHHPSRIITQYCDYMINAAVIKDHNDAGTTLCLKNNYGSFNGIGVNQMHTHSTYGDGHTRGEPELNRVLRDELGDKTVLFLIDGTYGLFYGGPGYVPPYHTPPNWIYNSVIVGFDPVAIDTIGTAKINEERVANGLGTLSPSHIAASAGEPYLLGTDKLANIELVEIDASQVSGVEQPWQDACGVVLLTPYPNPSPAASTLRFSAQGAADVELQIVDLRGRRVRRLVAGRFDTGVHRFRWDGKDGQGRDAPSGVYFCRLLHGGQTQQQRLVLVR